jgi:putative redox protein
MAKMTTRYKGDMLFESEMGNHSLLIDLPSSKGGADRGPQPAELFIAALASSIGASVADHCTRLGFDTRDMTVTIQFNEVDRPTRLANLQVTICLPRCMCAGQEQAILQLTEHCLIYETLGNRNGIQIELVDRQRADVLKWLA